jgi:hypothetical protein
LGFTLHLQLLEAKSFHSGFFWDLVWVAHIIARINISTSEQAEMVATAKVKKRTLSKNIVDLQTYQSFTKITNQNHEEILVLRILVIRTEICIPLPASLTRLSHLYHAYNKDSCIPRALNTNRNKKNER